MMQNRIHDRAAFVASTADEAQKTDSLPDDLRYKVSESIGTAIRCARTSGPAALVSLDIALAVHKVNLKLIAAYARKRDEVGIDEWVSLALRRGASLAHNWAKGIPPQVPPISHSHKGPIPLLDEKRLEWAPRWQRDTTAVDAIQLLCKEVHTQALELDPVQVSADQLGIHLGRTKASRATGLDGLTNQDLRHAPPEARPGLCAIINRILATLVVPAQWRANAVQLIPKPKGGDRPITVTSTLYSLVMDVLGVQMNDWQEDQQAF